VVIAGTTVIVSMLGLFAMGLSYMRGAALVAIVGVLVVLAASVTLFPALLGYLGRHVDRLRLPTGRRRAAATLSADGHAEPSRVWRRWSGLVERHRVVAVLAGVAVMLALAVPFLGVQFGFPDAGNNRTGSMTRQAYDAIADGFGVGANGPLLLAVDVPGTGGPAVPDGLRTAVAATPGVASVRPGTPRSSPSSRPPARRTTPPRIWCAGFATRPSRPPARRCWSAERPPPRSTVRPTWPAASRT
jgi:RND superfamily putative drug exporter